MTTRKSFKRLVRARMEKTGESYTTARMSLLAASEPKANEGPALPMSDEAIRRRTGRGWEEWFGLIDEWGGIERPHREIAAWVREHLDVDGWSAQSVTVGYERARGLRAVGENASGFTATASKTVAVPIDRLYDAFVDPALRERWLPGVELRERTATRPRSARFDFGAGESRVVVGFEEKGNGKSVAALQHERLPDGDEAERMKAFWRERVAVLKEELESVSRSPAGETA